MPPVALTIASSDPLGGAGIQADLATFAAFGVHGTSVITAVTSQSLREVTAAESVDARMVAAQIDAVVGDFAVAGCKTGLLRRREVVDLVAARVEAGNLPALVVDPVMVDRRGRRFVDGEVERAYRQRLFPLARVITPNRSEAELLVGAHLPGPEAVLERADELRSLGAEAVVVTGGGFLGPADDVVVTAYGEAWTEPGSRIQTTNVRGTGCTFSAALASGMARGMEVASAVREARRFVRTAIERSADWRLHGPGPVSHATA